MALPRLASVAVSQDMEEVSLKPKFRATLECPKCNGYFTPPVCVCPFGHTICGPCKGDSLVCPICHNLYGPAARNFTLERMLENITILCKFPGCGKEVTLAERQNHARSCAFSPMVQCFAGCEADFEDIVHARSYAGAFHISLFSVSRSKPTLILTINNDDSYIRFKGKAPHVSEILKNKQILPHLNCDCAVLLSSYLQKNEDDEEILKLWVEVQRVE